MRKLSRVLGIVIAATAIGSVSFANTLRAHAVQWNGPGWYLVQFDIDWLADYIDVALISGPFPDDGSCRAVQPPNEKSNVIDKRYECRFVDSAAAEIPTPEP